MRFIIEIALFFLQFKYIRDLLCSEFDIPGINFIYHFEENAGTHPLMFEATLGST